MSHVSKMLRLGLVLLLTVSTPLGVWNTLLAQQQGTAKAHADQGATVSSTFATDFEVKNDPQGLLVRRKGTQEWLGPGKFNEPIAVGLLDSDHKIYLVTKLVELPKVKQSLDPEFPETERRFRNRGWVTLNIVVDEQGTVRQPSVVASLSPAFAEAAIDAVKNWKFEPAKLDGQPVAVLIRVQFTLKLERCC